MQEFAPKLFKYIFTLQSINPFVPSTDMSLRIFHFITYIYVMYNILCEYKNMEANYLIIVISLYTNVHLSVPPLAQTDSMHHMGYIIYYVCINEELSLILSVSLSCHPSFPNTSYILQAPLCKGTAPFMH